MSKQLFQYSFSHTLKGVLGDYGITNYKLSKVSELDQAHVSRLVSGKRKRPNSTTVQKLTLALARLEVSNTDISRVQKSAGFDSFDSSTIAPGVEISPRTARRKRVTRKVVDPPEITFDTSATPPPTYGGKRPRSRNLEPVKLNMGDKNDMTRFLEELGNSAIVLPDIKAC